MKQRYHYFRRENGIYYSLDTLTMKRGSLETSDEAEAQRLVNALNEAARQPAVNLQIAQVYLQHSDPDFGIRTWQHVMDEMGKSKSGSTKKRWEVAMKDKAFDPLRKLVLIKTQGEHKGLDQKFTNTEIGSLKDQLAEAHLSEKIKNDRLKELEDRFALMEKHFSDIAAVLQKHPSIAAVEAALRRKRPVG